MEGDRPESANPPPTAPIRRPASPAIELPHSGRIGNYELVHVLGRGGMGVVWRARDARLRREVAIKALPATLAADVEARVRFEREARTLAALDHPNLVPIFAIEEVEGSTYLILPLVEGETLAERIARGALPAAEALRICAQIAAGVEAAHARGIVHRDLKPANVRVTPEGIAKVLDFGIAKIVVPAPGTENMPASAITGSGIAVGTPGYMSPEQARGEPVDVRADVWALGCVLFTCLTGASAFAGNTPVDRMMAVLDREPDWQALPADLPPRLGDLLEKCLEKDVSRRLASMADVRKEIEAILAGATDAEPSGARRRPARGNLPRPPTSFVGRQAEMADIAGHLRTSRLLTLSGTGGCGKTRLAVEAARAIASSEPDRWPGGTWFADLTEARSVEGIASAVAGVLGVPLGRADPVMQLGHVIAGRGRCLIILDNFEQVVEHAAATVEKWVERAGDAAFVVTSRERLLIPGEQVLPIEPLPPEGAGLELFVARAQAQKPDFALTPQNDAAVREVVRLLDGLPLAIELAAARVRALSPAQLLERMKDRFKVLAGARGVAEKQATMRAAIDWSWAMLASWEQAALAQASVFVGGFTLEAGEAVLELSQWPEAPLAMDVVQDLVDKSLLRTWTPTAGAARHDIEEPHFGMYVSVHDYAAEKLRTEGAIPDAASGASAEAAAVERHGRFYARFGTDEALEALDTHGGTARRAALTLELENLVAACRRAVERGDGSVAAETFLGAAAAIRFRGPLLRSVDLGREVLGIATLGLRERAAILLARAHALRMAGRLEESTESLEEALSLARKLGDRRLEGRALGNLGTALFYLGRAETAAEHLTLATALARETNDRSAEGAWLTNMAIQHDMEGRTPEGLRHYHEALDVFRLLGHADFEGNVLANLASVSQQLGNYDEALARYGQALAIYRQCGDRRCEGVVLQNLGTLHADAGLVDLARRHHQEALAVHREVGNRRNEGLTLLHLGEIDHDQDRARHHVEEALVIAEQVGDPHVEGKCLDVLAGLFRDRGELGEARRHWERALGKFQLVNSRRNQGVVQGKLAVVAALEGRFAEARLTSSEGEAHLRAAEEPVNLGLLLCRRCTSEQLAGDLRAASTALDEADAIAKALAVGPDSALGSSIARLRASLRESLDQPSD